MNENLNLVEMLKDVPAGSELYSPIVGTVTLRAIEPNSHCPIVVRHGNEMTISFTEKGCYFPDCKDAECLLFPSKEQRDWNKFVLPLKEGTPVMISDSDESFSLRYYARNNEVYRYGKKDGPTTAWEIIIPYEKFDPNDIEESLKYNIVKK